MPFEEVLKVPLVISYPSRLRASPVRVVEGLTWQLDLMPTILGLAGVLNPGRPRGMDLTPVLLGRESVPKDRTVFPAVLHSSHRGKRPLRRVVLQGAFKFIEGHEEFGDAEGLLFDVRADPREFRNLREVRPAEFEKLGALARQWASGLDPDSAVYQLTRKPLDAGVRGEVPVDLSEEEMDELRALGYLD